MTAFDLQAALNKGTNRPITFVVLQADRDTFVRPNGPANKNEVRARDSTATEWDASFHRFIDARRIVIKLQRLRNVDEVESDPAELDQNSECDDREESDRRQSDRNDSLLLNVTVTNNGVVTPFDMSVSAAVFS